MISFCMTCASMQVLLTLLERIPEKIVISIPRINTQYFHEVYLLSNLLTGDAFMKLGIKNNFAAFSKKNQFLQKQAK